MSLVVPFFLLAPLFLVPFGLRLLAVATPGSEPPRRARLAALPAALLLTLSFFNERGAIAAALSLPWLAVTATVAVTAGMQLLRDPDRFRPSDRHATDPAGSVPSHTADRRGYSRGFGAGRNRRMWTGCGQSLRNRPVLGETRG